MKRAMGNPYSHTRMMIGEFHVADKNKNLNT